MNFLVRLATIDDMVYTQQISDMYVLSSKERGTGIAIRTPEYLKDKIEKGNGIIAFDDDGSLAGFCYIETFKGNYVSNSGLIVKSEFRGYGLGKTIKSNAFHLARDKYPDAKIFGITTNAKVMAMNSELGYIPVTFNMLTTDEEFWNGCKSCKNFEILSRNNHTMCLCTAMLAKSKNDVELQKKNSISDNNDK